MKKKLSKGIIHPMLLDYLITFGTEWRPHEEVFQFRMKQAENMAWQGKSPFRQAMDFGYIETKTVLVGIVGIVGNHHVHHYYVRLTPKGLRRIARG